MGSSGSGQNQRAGASFASAIAAAVGTLIVTGFNPAGFIAAAKIFALTFASTFVAANLSKVRRPTLDNTSSRTLTIRRPISTRRVYYGEGRVGGILTFYHPGQDDVVGQTNTIPPAYMVVTLCDGPIEEIGTVWIDGVPVPPEHLNDVGHVTDGPFAVATDANPSSNVAVVIEKHLGTEDQTVNQWLFDNTPVGNTFDGKGVAYLAIWINNDPELFSGSVPNISATIKGKQAEDPRELRVSTVPEFTQNPVVALYDYLTSERYGLGIKQDRLDMEWFRSEANVCDEFVETAETRSVITGTGNDAGVDWMVTEDIVTPFFYGDRVRLRVGDVDTAAFGFAAGTDLYVDVIREGPDEQHIRVATTFDGLRGGIFQQVFTSTTVPDGLEIVKTGEPRYSISGLVDTANTPKDSIQEIADAMAGSVVVSGGVWRPIAGRYITPSLDIDDDNLHGEIQTSTRVTRTARANVIEGVYVSHLFDSQPNDYPPVRDDDAVTADGAELTGSLDLSMVARPSQAQRVANIHLQRLRNEITATIRVPLRAALVQAGDTIRLTHEQWDWDRKEFEIQNWLVTQSADADTGPSIEVELSLREYSRDIFDWDTDNEAAVSPGPPIGSSLSEYIDFPAGFTATRNGGTGDGYNHTGVTFTWDAPTGVYVGGFLTIVPPGSARHQLVDLSDETATTSGGPSNRTRTIHYRVKAGAGGYTEWRSITLQGDAPWDPGEIDE